MTRLYRHEILERLACDLANLWLVQRRDPRVLGAMDPLFARKLDELEGLTSGDERRCFCLAKGTGQHDLNCPAREV